MIVRPPYDLQAITTGATGPRKGQEGTGSVRFVSVPDSSRKLIGSVRFGSDKCVSLFDAVRPALSGRVVALSGSVPRPAPAGSGIKRFGSVRFGFLLLPAKVAVGLVELNQLNQTLCAAPSRRPVEAVPPTEQEPPTPTP